MLEIKDVDRLVAEESHFLNRDGGEESGNIVENWLERESISREVFDGIADQIVEIAMSKFLESVLHGEEQMGVEAALKNIHAAVQGSFHIGYMLGKEYGKGGDTTELPS